MTSKENQQFHRYVINLSHRIDVGGYKAGIAAETVLTIWSQTQCPSLSCTGLEFSKKLASEPEFKCFVAWLLELPMLDSAYWLSSAYAIWTGTEYRKNLAMYFTPAALTKRLLDDLEQAGVSFVEHTFFDPACGGAAFLAPIAQRMRLKLHANGATSHQILNHVERRLCGIDLDAVLCRMSLHFLRMVFAEEIADAQFEPEFRIAQANSLMDIDKFAGTIDVVICNPPYRKLRTDEVSVYRDSYSNIIEAQPNLYGLFIVLCLRLLKPRGLAALVTPTSFLSGQSFSKLRSFLMENAEILQIGIVAERSGVFINVEQETSLTLLRQRQPVHATETTTQVAIVSRDGSSNSVGLCVLPNSGSAWPVPRTEGDAELLRCAGDSHYRLSDYGYRARIGAIVWNRDKRRTFLSKKDAQRAKSSNVVPLLWSSDIQQGRNVNFLGKKKTKDEHSFIEITSVDNPCVIKRPSVLLQRVTSNEQPRRLVASVVPTSLFQKHGGFAGENHTVILEEIDERGIPPDLLMAVISSLPIERYFRCISGATNVSLFELSQLPLPSPDRLLTALERGLCMDAAIIEAFTQITT